MKKVVIESIDNYRLDTVKAALSRIFYGYGLSHTNPLGKYIKPGNRVFIKPNWVASRWRESCPHKDTLYSVITHPNIIEGVADYVAEALQGKGEILIGDNSSIDADFQELMEFTGIRRLENKYNVKVTILDLRLLICDNLVNYGKKNLMVHQKGDPYGEVEINLGKESLLYDLEPDRFRGVFDERDETIASHTGEIQLYTFSKSLYDADVYISIPKLKTHQKVGATLNLKGLVGAVSNKNQLVHWQVGYPETHGDEYPSKEAYEAAQSAKVTHRGAWPGNDTIWRMVVDIYNAMLKKERIYLSVVDGVIAGEGQGPFCPTSKNANVIIAGDDLFVVDCVAARYMGLDPQKIKYLSFFLNNEDFGINYSDMEVLMANKRCDDFFLNDSRYADFLVMNQWESIRYNNV